MSDRITAITMPKWGMAMDEGTVVVWHVPEGGAVAEGQEIVDVESPKIANAIEAKAGDLMLLHSLTPHRSASNRSDEMRRALLFTYGVDPREDLYAVYKQLQEALRRQ